MKVILEIHYRFAQILMNVVNIHVQIMLFATISQEVLNVNVLKDMTEMPGKVALELKLKYVVKEIMNVQTMPTV